MRLLIPLSLALTLTLACKPEITSNTYFCGPERNCPPGLACQEGQLESFPFSCVGPLSVTSFSCPQPSGDHEPDDTSETAQDLGELECGSQLELSNWGCISTANDVDHFSLQRDALCAGDESRFRGKLRYPLGLAPLSLELLDASGMIMATAELCTSAVDTSGSDERCIEVSDLAPGTYTLRVSVDSDANADCDGDCAYNRYQLFASVPLS